MLNNEPRGIGTMAGISPAVRFLLILNVAVFVLDIILQHALTNMFELPAVWWHSLSFGKLFTYMFIHFDFRHLLVNMLGLFFIGPTVERTLGTYRFFILYYVSGMLGGLGWSLLANEGARCVGASGAVMGVLGAFGTLYPNVKLLLWFIIPVRAWVLVVGLVLWELHETVSPEHVGGIANAAHLVGALAGICCALALKYPNWEKDLWKKIRRGKITFASKPPPADSSALSKEEIDRILDKIGKEGMGALTQQEREKLTRATRR